MKCCVKNCLNKFSTDSQKAYFSFPKDKKLKKKWLNFCGKSRCGKISRSCRVCEVHFTNEDLIGKYQRDLGISRKLLLKPGAVPSILVADSNENIGERGKRLADRSRRLVVESLLKDVQYLPENKTENAEESLSTEQMHDLLHNAEVINTVTPEQEHEDNNSDAQQQIKFLENKLKLLQGENDRLIKTLSNNESSYKYMLSKKDYEIEQLKLALCKSEHRCTNMETHLREI